MYINSLKARNIGMSSEYKCLRHYNLIGENEKNLLNKIVTLKYLKYGNRFRLYKDFVKSKRKLIKD